MELFYYVLLIPRFSIACCPWQLGLSITSAACHFWIPGSGGSNLGWGQTSGYSRICLRSWWYAAARSNPITLCLSVWYIRRFTGAIWLFWAQRSVLFSSMLGQIIRLITRNLRRLTADFIVGCCTFTRCIWSQKCERRGCCRSYFRCRSPFWLTKTVHWW